jgi:hypothetical protein
MLPVPIRITLDIMFKFTKWLAAILLLVTPQFASAQHSGRGAGGANGTSAGTYPRDTDSDIKDIQKAFAIQATADQKTQFQSWIQNTEAVKRQLQELCAATAGIDFSNQLNALKAAQEKSSGGYQDFAGTLTEAQNAGLKKSIQKLGKINSALAKAVTIVIQEFGQANSAKRAAKVANAQVAVEKLLNQQNRIAVEMSIGS